MEKAKEQSRKLLSIMYDKLSRDLEDDKQIELILDYVSITHIKSKNIDYDVKSLNSILDKCIEDLKKAKKIINETKSFKYGLIEKELRDLGFNNKENEQIFFLDINEKNSIEVAHDLVYLNECFEFKYDLEKLKRLIKKCKKHN